MSDDVNGNGHDGVVAIAMEMVSAVKGLDSTYSTLERTVREDLAKQQAAFNERAEANGSLVKEVLSFQRDTFKPFLDRVETTLDGIAAVEKEKLELAKQQAAEEVERRKNARKTVSAMLSSTPANYLFMALAIVLATWVSRQFGVTPPEYPAPQPTVITEESP